MNAPDLANPPANPGTIRIGLWMNDTLILAAKMVEKTWDFKAVAERHFQEVLPSLWASPQDGIGVMSFTDPGIWQDDPAEAEIAELISVRLNDWAAPGNVLRLGKALAGWCEPTPKGWKKYRVYPIDRRRPGKDWQGWCANEITQGFEDAARRPLPQPVFESLCRMPICATYYVEIARPTP